MDIYEKKARSEKWLPYMEAATKAQKNGMIMAIREFTCQPHDIDTDHLYLHLNEHGKVDEIMTGIMSWQDLIEKKGIFVNTKPTFYWFFGNKVLCFFYLNEGDLELVRTAKIKGDAADAALAMAGEYARENSIPDYTVKEVI